MSLPLRWLLIGFSLGALGASASPQVPEKLSVHGLRDLYTGRVVKTEGAAVFVVTRPDCPACARITRELACIRDGLAPSMDGEKPEIYLVATGESTEALQRAYHREKRSFRVLTAPEKTLSSVLVFSATPGVLVLDSQGREVLRFQGFRTCSRALQGLSQ